MKRAAPASSVYNPTNRYKRARYPPKPSEPGALVIRAQKREIVASRQTGKVELKVTQFQYQNSVSNAGHVSDLLSNMIPGTSSVNNFVGNEILPTSVRVHVSITMGPLAGVGDGTNICRLVLFQWKDSIVPAVNGVLAIGTAPQSQYLWDNIENMNILADRMYALKQIVPNSGYDAICDKIYIKGKNMTPVKWNTSTGAVQKGGIYALMISDSSIPPAPYFSLYTQVTYTDA